MKHLRATKNFVAPKRTLAVGRLGSRRVGGRQNGGSVRKRLYPTLSYARLRARVAVNPYKSSVSDC
jgi:hypothetical protein